MYPNSGLTLSIKAWGFLVETNGKFWRKWRVGRHWCCRIKVLRSHRHGCGILMRFGADDVKVRTRGFPGERYS